jgi:NAD(P)-dependent dehydrogenase (short-subunit alcohol dehydrogenase family)
MNIIITGTSRGIGKALARKYVENNNSVFGISRNTSKELIKYDNYNHLSIDLGDDKDLKESFKNFIGEGQSFDLVILNAGILPEINDMINTYMEELKKVMQVNLWANKYIIDALFVLNHKVNQIVAISSGAAVSGSRGWNAYAISKAALNSMISLYSKEIPETHFSAIAPGVIDTYMQEYIYNLPEEHHYPIIQRLREMRDRNEMYTPEEAAKNLIRVFPLLKRYESGAFVDVREI